MVNVWQGTAGLNVPIVVSSQSSDVSQRKFKLLRANSMVAPPSTYTDSCNQTSLLESEVPVLVCKLKNRFDLPSPSREVKTDFLAPPQATCVNSFRFSLAFIISDFLLLLYSLLHLYLFFKEYFFLVSFAFHLCSSLSKENTLVNHMSWKEA